MAQAEAGLELPIGISEKDFLRSLARIEARAIKTANDMERRFINSNKSISNNFRSIGGGANAFSSISTKATAATASVIALGAALGKLNQYADSYKTIENRLGSIGQTSDEAAEKLLASAIRSRSAVEEMSTMVARLQKSTGDGYDETLRRAETLNKMLAVGGATTAEVSSVATQLTQALSSGVLQGDELRSLRETAPVEFLDALAAAAGTTRGELKSLGEEGKLTSDIVIQALDSLAATADEKFAQTTQTAGQAFTNLNSAATVFIGRLDEGLGSSEAFVQMLTDMATWLQQNADTAEEFGQSVSAGIETAKQVASDLKGQLDQLALTINEALFSSISGVGEAFRESGSESTSVISTIIDAIAEMNGVIEGAAGAAREAFLTIPDAVSGAMQSALNAIIAGVEGMVNAVLSGVRNVASAIDGMTAGYAALANKLPGVDAVAGSNLAGALPQNVSLGRAEGIATDYSSRGIGQAYREDYEAGKAKVENFVKGVEDTYNANLTRIQIAERTPLSMTLPDGSKPTAGAAVTPSASSGGGGGRKRSGGRGGAGREERPFFEDIEKDLTNLQRQFELIGKNTEQVATLKAQWELLDEAKKRGITVDDALNAKIQAQAASFGSLTAQLEASEMAYDQFEQGVDSIATTMSDVLLAGEDWRQSLANVFKGLAADILQSGIKNAIMSQVSGATGGGGFFGNLLGSLFGGLPGRATGGPVSAGQAYMVGERGPEPFVPSVDGRILSVPQAQAALRGNGGGGMNVSFSPNITASPGVTQAELSMTMATARQEYERNFLPMLRKKFPEFQKRFG